MDKNNKTYTIGIDFGTLSARAGLVDTAKGHILGFQEFVYPHGVMDERLPDGQPLPADWALQDPRDYWQALAETIPALLRACGIEKEAVVGLALDFTSCTQLPVDVQGNPLCQKEGFRTNPHSYVKLWKHHAPQKYAERINQLAQERQESWLPRYGGRTSSEWAFSKMLETYSQAPSVFEAAHQFLEAGDWLVQRLTGKTQGSGVMAGYKALWSREEGYPSPDFLEAVQPGFSRALDKLPHTLLPVGSPAGHLTPEAAAHCGLTTQVVVASALIDAHTAMAAVGKPEDGRLLMILGTSNCHILLSHKEIPVQGICGYMKEGVAPGFYAYEAGQPCTGDGLDWFLHNLVGRVTQEKAQVQGKDLHTYLGELARQKPPGQSHLLALDWWNGNRSILSDSDLSGVLVGMTLQTKEEDIYRALVEANAYGARKILETLEEAGLPVEQVIATGGIAHKDPFSMQIYADVLNRPVGLATTTQGSVLGAAIYGAVAAGVYPDFETGAKAMGGYVPAVFHPRKKESTIYNTLYQAYLELHQYFGKTSPLMHKLKSLSQEE